jgi:hypothetical protein
MTEVLSCVFTETVAVLADGGELSVNTVAGKHEGRNAGTRIRRENYEAVN